MRPTGSAPISSMIRVESITPMHHLSTGLSKLKKSAAISLAAGLSLAACATTAAPPALLEQQETVVYKTVGEDELSLHVFRPEGQLSNDPRPSIVFFFGGGWNSGTPTQFYPHCEHLAARGMVAISAEYRVRSRHGTPPATCIEDGKSALRWIRSHAEELGVDGERVAAGGGSAGGHVAAAIATVAGFNAERDDRSISCVPDALVLFNPVFDNGPDGYGYDRVAEIWEEFSPLHNLAADTPPTIVYLGTKDKLIPVATAEAYRDRMLGLGARCDLHLYEGAGHGFFNESSSPAHYADTVQKMDAFLETLGFLEGL